MVICYFISVFVGSKRDPQMTLGARPCDGDNMSPRGDCMGQQLHNIDNEAQHELMT
jgi:hypothetical protein